MQFEPVSAGCKIAALAQFSVTMDGMRPMVVGGFKSTETFLTTDGGAFIRAGGHRP